MNGFPERFLWGAATAAYQIEGAVDQGGRGPSIWDTFSHTPGAVRDGDTGDVATDHYHRYAEDVELMARLGLRSYRFSLAWPRLQPTGRGALNPDGLDFYSRLVDALLARDIEPWVTLYHWDLPQALQDEGGWPARDTALRFADYAVAVHERLADRIPTWTTLNEPWVSAFAGHAQGRHAPGVRDRESALRAAHHLMLGHGLATRALRDAGRGSRLGVTLNLYPVDAATPDARDADAARRIDGLVNRFFLDPLLRGSYPEDVVADLAEVTDWSHVRDGDSATIAAPLDLLGINYYFRHVVRAGTPSGEPSAWVGSEHVEFVSRGRPTTEMGWEIDDQGLYDVLSRLRREYPPLPLYVTENGAAFPDTVSPDGAVHDPDRVAYLDAHFRSAAQAIRDGVDLRGYFVWSLLDNFEWAHGYSKRFGLVHVDYETLRRTPKDSFSFYADVIRRNGVADAAGSAGAN